jgi:hypothetical protein
MTKDQARLETKKQVVEEVDRFAIERDAIYERTRAKAVRLFRDEFDADALLKDPEKYIKTLFVKLGSRVIKEMIPMARKAGRDHAERLQSVEHFDA